MKPSAFAKPTHGLVVYQAAACRDSLTEWEVRGVKYGDVTSEVYTARFSGPGARERAVEYANWKNGTVARATQFWG